MQHTPTFLLFSVSKMHRNRSLITHFYVYLWPGELFLELSSKTKSRYNDHISCVGLIMIHLIHWD